MNGGDFSAFVQEMHGAMAKAMGLPAEMLTCEACRGHGLVRSHAAGCLDARCTLNGDQHSCSGQLIRCSCQHPGLGLFAMLEPEDCALETCEADAVEIPIPFLSPKPPTITLAALLLALELCSKLDSAFAWPFPSHPKPSRAWWDEVRALTDKGYPQLLAAVEAEAFTR